MVARKKCGTFSLFALKEFIISSSDTKCTQKITGGHKELIYEMGQSIHGSPGGKS
jgi:hypothetical protein